MDSPSKVNRAQLVGSQSGDVIVKVFDWTTWLAQWSRKVPNIKKGHQMSFPDRRKVIALECVQCDECSLGGYSYFKEILQLLL